MREPVAACFEEGCIEILPDSFRPVGHIPRTLREFNELGTLWAPLVAADYLQAYAKGLKRRLGR